MKKLLIVLIVVAILAVSVVPAYASSPECRGYLYSVKVWTKVASAYLSRELQVAKQYQAGTISQSQFEYLARSHAENFILAEETIVANLDMYAKQCR